MYYMQDMSCALLMAAGCGGDLGVQQTCSHQVGRRHFLLQRVTCSTDGQGQSSQEIVKIFIYNFCVGNITLISFMGQQQLCLHKMECQGN